MASEIIKKGFVIRIKGSSYYVVSGKEEARCVLRGKFRLKGDPGEVLPVVGDNVQFRADERGGSADSAGMIVSVEERRSVFARSASRGKRKKKILGANLDYVFLIHSYRRPDLNLRLVDRMLVSAEYGGIEPVICVNKVDLCEDIEALERDMLLYSDMGYRVILCSAAEDRNIDVIRSMIKGRRSLMAGPSGSGKTSIISRLEPHLVFRIGGVSEKTGKGKHTTTHFELHPLSGGGYLGDTPGIREFGLDLVERNELERYFRDFRNYRGLCRFNTCVHDSEPGCAVKEAVEGGNISRERYDSYKKMLEDLSD